MSAKASVSMSDSQEASARSLVQEGRYASLSAVIQHGLHLLQTQTMREQAEIDALRTFFEERADGAFHASATAKSAMQDTITRKCRAHGF